MLRVWRWLLSKIDVDLARMCRMAVVLTRNQRIQRKELQVGF
jgi:hypothetical protein